MPKLVENSNSVTTKFGIDLVDIRMVSSFDHSLNFNVGKNQMNLHQTLLKVAYLVSK
jgi:hypothetical protein